MKNVLFFLFITISSLANLVGQTNFENYKKIKIVSEYKLIVEVEINEKKCFVLIDTGSSVSILDMYKSSVFGYIKNGKYPNPIIGVNNSLQYMFYAKNICVKIGDTKTYQFVIGNISNIRDIIKNETGYEICGIIGYHTIKEIGLVLSPYENIIYIK